MKTVLKVAKKALPSASIYLVIFLGLVIAFSLLAKGDQEKKFKAKQMDIVVLDRDQSVLSKALTEYLATDNKVQTDTKEDLIPDLIFNGTVDYVMTIEKGFEQSIVSGSETPALIRESIQANTAFLDQEIDLYLRYVRTELATGKEMSKACEDVLAICEIEATTQLVGEKKSIINTLMTPSYYFFTYLAYALPAILIMILGPILQEFYKRDVKMRTDCARMSTRAQNTAIIGGMGIIAIGLWLIFIVVAVVLCFDDIEPKQFLFNLLNSFLFLLVSIAIAATIGMLVRGADALNGASNLISMGMAFICGIFVPGEFLPDYVTKIGDFLPASWYMKNVKLFYGAGVTKDTMNQFLTQSGVLLIFVVAFFCIALMTAKKKRTI